MPSVAPFGFRYQYLAGGVNTGGGWATWNPNGQFATLYIQESVANGITPVFTYYLLRQSAPGNSIGDDGQANETNMQNTSTMAAYYNDLKLLFPRSGAFPNNRVVVHLEPDLWGFLQRRASGDNATTPTRTATPSSGSTTVTFDDRPGQNVVLNGPYPSGVINWGQAASGTTRGRGGASPRRV